MEFGHEWYRGSPAGAACCAGSATNTHAVVHTSAHGGKGVRKGGLAPPPPPPPPTHPGAGVLAAEITLSFQLLKGPSVNL